MIFPHPVVADVRDAPPRPRSQRMPARRLAIGVAAGGGTGPTTLAAFDAALRGIGVADFNLIGLSSVIPPGSRVFRAPGPLAPAGGWGDRLYVVISRAVTDVPGTAVWAGVGWIQDPQTGQGLFAEHSGHSEADVVGDLEATLTSLRQGRGDVGEPMSDRQIITSGITCAREPSCAVVLAAFSAEPWHPTANG